MPMTDPNANTAIPAGPGGATLENEELRQMIEALTPYETPLYSNTRKGRTAALHTDWGTVALPAITTPTAQKRGFIAAINAPILPARLNNQCELVAETGGVADSYNALDLAGRESELDFQKLLKGKLVRRQVNNLLYANQAKAAAEPSTLAAFPTWVGGSRFRSIAGTPGTPATGDGSDVYVAGNTPDVLDTVDPIDDVMEACFATNGVPNTMYTSAKSKRQFSRIPDASVAENRINMTAGKVQAFQFIGTVDLYLSDFGTLEVVVDRDCPNSIIPFVDPDYLEIVTLPGRAFKVTDLAKVGSAEQFMVEWEGTLKVTNPTAHGMIEGIA